jgi:hydrogenase maturation protease
MRVLIAGVGNVLRGDDGFGVEVLHRLEQEIGPGAGITFFESGIAGISLVQQLLDGYDALLILDALDRGAEPGTIFVVEASRERERPEGSSEAIDLHQAGPEAVLRLAQVLGVLPRRTWVVGCQAAGCDELGDGLSDPVRRAIPAVMRRVYDILQDLRPDLGQTHGAV